MLLLLLQTHIKYTSSSRASPASNGSNFLPFHEPTYTVSVHSHPMHLANFFFYCCCWWCSGRRRQWVLDIVVHLWIGFGKLGEFNRINIYCDSDPCFCSLSCCWLQQNICNQMAKRGILSSLNHLLHQLISDYYDEQQLTKVPQEDHSLSCVKNEDGKSLCPISSSLAPLLRDCKLFPFGNWPYI